VCALWSTFKWGRNFQSFKEAGAFLENTTIKLHFNNSKRGASFIVTAVSRGALFPLILGSITDTLISNTQRAFFIPLIRFVIAFTFPVYLNVFKAKSLDG
jgi:fucose permease